ncbi:valine--tRNA ligase [Roseitranquillus sediminis]|uniref:valine--tRNA ligase n=1 Tax=Roseitranquillus sediminis TaxID=2809051 RepID=UPI001D0CA26F|nr:valine--tRNA ligase [Roseitranquillus sediminis]MBM9595814.1 valine--tRNA ligase [Roseitranquillus sediminis]
MEKTFDAAAREGEIYAAWDRACVFRAGAGARPGPDGQPPETFSIMIPPPNVTGALHMGHAFNNTLQDILTRWHRMRGHDTLWQPGTDHAGIATQMVVERELAREGAPSRREMGRPAFIERVWQQKQKSRGNIRSQLERLGASCDWSREAFTMGGAPGDPDRAGPNFHDAVLKVFVDLYDKGLIYRGKRLVNWDPHFETAISDLEVEQTEVDGRMWHFKYPLAGGATYEYVEKDADGNVTLRETRDYISIATTRPETMLGDGAVAVHPSDARYAPIVGKLCEIPVGPKEHRRLIPIITDPYPDPDFGSGAVKITGAHDFNDYAVAERGGIPKYRLMDTRARMRDDGEPYADAAALALAVARGEYSSLTAEEADAINLVPDDLRGLDRFEARERVVEQITAEGLAVMVPETDPRLGTAALKAPAAPEEGAAEPREERLVPLVEHRKMVQPHGDRSKVVIEPMLTDQWFVDAGKIVQPAIDAVRDGRTTILPESDAKVYFHWLENIEPWCISRQLWWGHQIPVWYGLDLWVDAFRDDEGDGALDEVELGRLLGDGGMLHEGEVRHAGVGFEAVRDRFHDDTARLPTPLNHATVIEVADKQEAIHRLAESLAQYAVEQDPTHLVYPVWRDADVLDTWFSSGLWPLGTLGWPEDTEELRRYFPTSVLVTGFDIIFFWVARMMMMQLELVGQVPFRTVYVHALVRDEKGKKMSKSLGNAMDPIDLVDEFGADAVRFTLTAMAAMGRDLKLSKERIAGYRNFVTKLWNAHRFAEMNGVFSSTNLQNRGADLAGSCKNPPSATATANRWIIGETGRVREEVDAALAAFRFNDAANALYAFVWGRVCDWYVEFAKPLFDGDNSEETRAVMAWVLDQCLILLHPIMPFVTEELWGISGRRGNMLAHAEWPNYGTELVDPASDSEMRRVIGLIEAVRSVRGEMNVPAGAKVPLLLIELDEAGRNALTRNEDLVLRLARLEAISLAEAAPRGSATIAVEGGTFALPLADVIDIDAEKARLSKTLEKLSKDANGLRSRLSNPKFAASAPPEVVEETRETLATKEEEHARLEAALARLSDAG